jgi:hypothetical protein
MGSLCSDKRSLCQYRLQIRRIKRWITLPEEGRLPSIIPKREGISKFLDARDEDVISEIPPDTGQMLHDIDTGTG